MNSRLFTPAAPIEGRSVVPALIVFTSMHDASRGPLAAALFNATADPTLARATSAGIRPARGVSSFFSKALEDEPHCDIRDHNPRRLTDTLLKAAELVVILGIRGEFVDLGRPCMRWDVPLVDTRDAAAVHHVRDELQSLVDRLVASRGWTRSGATTAREGNG